MLNQHSTSNQHFTSNRYSDNKQKREHADVAIAYFGDEQAVIEYSLDGENWFEWTEEAAPPFLQDWDYRIKK